jgi:hypothetical protein
MDAGIRSPGARDDDTAALDRGQRTLEQRLDRRALGLPLPADEVGAVIRERQLQRARRGVLLGI